MSPTVHLDIRNVAVSPAETDSPLVVDADAEFAISVALQYFQAVPWGNTKVLKA
jgi:hypothetical protein